jgi:hypothetical protein
VSTNEYDLTDLPVYIRSPEDDPNAVSVLIDPYHGVPSQSSLDLSPEASYQSEQPLYAPEGGNYETTPGPSYVPLPPDTEDRPPYHPPEPDYPEEHETVSDRSRFIDLDLSPSETSTFMSGDFPMLQRPMSHSSTGSNGTAALPYLDELEPPSQGRFAASSSSRNVNTSNIPVRTIESDPSWNVAGPSNIARRVTNDLFALRNFDQTIEDSELDPDYYEDPDQFLDLSLLSNIAFQIQLKVPRGTHVKGSIPYPGAFTGKDIVVSLRTQDRVNHLELKCRLFSDHYPCHFGTKAHTPT